MESLQIFAALTVFMLMLSIGMKQSLSQFADAWKKPGDLFRALFSVLILFPALAFGLLKFLDLPPEIATGIAVLAACIGAPMTTKRSQLATADYDFVASVQLTMALLTVFVTPTILAIFYSQFDITIEPVPPIKVAAQVGLVTFLPVVIGQVLKTTVPDLVSQIRDPIEKLSDIMFLILMVSAFAAIAVVPAMRHKLLLGWLAVATLLALPVCAVIMGHLIGGANRSLRSGLAILTLARNVGLGLMIVNLCEPGQESVPTLMTYAVFGTIVGISYSLWVKRRHR